MLLQVEGMTCDGCGQTIQYVLKRAKGVKRVEVDWRAGVAEVTFDREVTDQEAILDHLIFRGRYQARLSPRGCCRWHERS